VRALQGDGDLDGDGYMTASELGQYLETKVVEYRGEQQTPQYGKLNDPLLNQGDFVFALRKAAPEPEPPAVVPQAVPQPEERLDVEAWAMVQDSDDPEDLQFFIEQFPDSPRVKLARLKLKMLERKQVKAKVEQQQLAKEAKQLAEERQRLEAEKLQLAEAKRKAKEEQKRKLEVERKQQLAKEAKRLEEERKQLEAEKLQLAEAKRKAKEERKQQAELAVLRQKQAAEAKRKPKISLLSSAYLQQIPDDLKQYFQNFVIYEDHTYAITRRSVRWSEAKRLAEQNGGHLVTINNAQENEFLADHLSRTGKHAVFIGLHDQNKEGFWEWSYGTSTYANWGSSEPNDAGAGEDYVLIYKKKGIWNDVPDGNAHALIEWEQSIVNKPSNLIFSDNFENAYFSKNWNSGGCKEANTLNIVNQRLQSMSNGCYVNLRRKINGDVRIEFDVEKDGYKNHGCHDYQVYWGNDYRVVLLFNKNGQDMLGIGKNDFCSKMDKYTTFKAGMQKKKMGKLIISLSKKGIKAQFIEKNGRTLSVIKKNTSNRFYKPIRIDIAAHRDAPRSVDNLRIVRLSEEEQKSQKITKKKNESTSKTTSLASIRQTYHKAVKYNTIFGFRSFIKEYEHEQRASYYVNLVKKKLKKLKGVNETTTTSSSEASSGYTKRQAYLDFLEAKVSNTKTALRNFLRKHAQTPGSESYRVRARKLLKNF
jgi:hypothetical protein